MAKVYVLAKPAIDQDELERFLADEGLDWRRTAGSSQAEKLTEIAGRICYLSFGEAQSPRDNFAYIRNLIDQGHESVLEHVRWTFLLTGVSRAFTHQLVRHRVGFSYSQLSQQYHDESAFDLIEPAGIERVPEAAAAWRAATTASRAAYRAILDSLEEQRTEDSEERLPKEQLRAIRSAARSVLPNAAETKIVVSVNARALRHFLRLRGSIVGDEEMRRVSALLLASAKKDAAALFQDFESRTLSDGSPIVEPLHSESNTLQVHPRSKPE